MRVGERILKTWKKWHFLSPFSCWFLHFLRLPALLTFLKSWVIITMITIHPTYPSRFSPTHLTDHPPPQIHILLPLQLSPPADWLQVHMAVMAAPAVNV